MRLTVFQAGKGDCLLLTAADGTRMLVDGGMRAAYREHVAGALGRLREQGHELDVVCLSHIDRDHISGVLQLLDDEVDWRVFDYQRSEGNTRFREPTRPRPPVVRDLWHNGFREQVDANAGEIEELLAAKATVLATSAAPRLRALAGDHRELAASIPEGIELSRRASAEQLGIRLNHHYGGKLALVRDGQAPIRLGSLTVTPIGPFPEELDELRGEWNDWLRENRAQHERLRRRMRDDAARLHANEVAALREPLRLAAEELGDRGKVTVPNLASLMLLVEEDGRSLLLTGDGHWETILRGLRRAGRLPRGRGLHVDVLKVQHHGSEHNLTPAFARRVTADTYVFCANGEHANPDRRIVQAILDSRLGPGRRRTRNPEAAGRFRFVFNSAARMVEEGDAREHMLAIERLVREAARGSGGRLRYEFSRGSSVDLDLG